VRLPEKHGLFLGRIFPPSRLNFWGFLKIHDFSSSAFCLINPAASLKGLRPVHQGNLAGSCRKLKALLARLHLAKHEYPERMMSSQGRLLMTMSPPIHLFGFKEILHPRLSHSLSIGESINGKLTLKSFVLGRF